MSDAASNRGFLFARTNLQDCGGQEKYYLNKIVAG